MQIIISPAKKIALKDYQNKEDCQLPEFLEKAKELVKHMQQYKVSDLEKLMHISKNVASLNVDRYKAFKFSQSSSHPAIFTFAGEVYSGLAAGNMSAENIRFANKHLNILSGLYGLIRPLDLIEPYRLEMGSKVQIGSNKNLYDFWQESLTEKIQKNLNEDDNILLNLASNEYSKAIKKSKLNTKIITANFKERRGDELKDIMVYTKKARGLLARFVIDKKISDEKKLVEFNYENYRFSPNHSQDKPNEQILTFIR